LEEVGSVAKQGGSATLNLNSRTSWKIFSKKDIFLKVNEYDRVPTVPLPGLRAFLLCIIYDN
jgi:hypothetical protein